MPKHKKQKKGGFGRGFKKVIVLGIFIMSFMVIMFVGQDVLDAIPFIHIIMTLGNLETYQDTVTGVSIVFLLIGLAMIALERD